MKVLIVLLALGMAAKFAAVSCAPVSGGHKSKAEIERMTPAQRVEEYCREYLRHRYENLDDDYGRLLKVYVERDGINAVAQLAKLVNEYDPAQRDGSTREKADRCEAAVLLLYAKDVNVVRLRASEEGRRGVEAVRDLVERMRAVHFDSSESYEYRKQGRYEIFLSYLREMEGTNDCDLAIRNTLRLKYKVSLSDNETLDFVNYLISRDPYYPGWSQSERYKSNELNRAGNPISYLIQKSPEPFHTAYLQFKAAR
jgi:hypothetical protein